MGEGYRQHFCPISRGAEIFATRWTPIIVRNLLLGCTTFSEIREGAPGIPRSLLAERLKQLEYAGVVERRAKPNGRGWLYELTQTGRELEPVCNALGSWGQRWLEAVPSEIDPGGLLWAVCKSIDQQQLPDERLVVRVVFRGAEKKRFWLLVQPPEPEVCVKPPGFDEDLVLTCDIESLARWHMGSLQLGQAMRSGRITFEGSRSLVREFSRWNGVSPFAAIESARGAAAAR